MRALTTVAGHLSGREKRKNISMKYELTSCPWLIVQAASQHWWWKSIVKHRNLVSRPAAGHYLHSPHQAINYITTSGDWRGRTSQTDSLWANVTTVEDIIINGSEAITSRPFLRCCDGWDHKWGERGFLDLPQAQIPSHSMYRPGGGGLARHYSTRLRL